MWSQLFFVLLLVFIGWLVYRQVKGNPGAFSRENMGKSVYTLGVLALILIAFVWLLILLVR